MIEVALFPKMFASNLDFMTFVLNFMLDPGPNPVPEPEPDPEPKCVTVPAPALLRQKRCGSVSSSGSGSATLSFNTFISFFQLIQIPANKIVSAWQMHE